MKYEVYKKIRLKATIFGMPSLNFILMLVFDIFLFLMLLTGLSFFKVLGVLIGWAISFVCARFVFNKKATPKKMNDYIRY